MIGTQRAASDFVSSQRKGSLGVIYNCTFIAHRGGVCPGFTALGQVLGHMNTMAAVAKGRALMSGESCSVL